jgi:hypothetical protein
MSQRRLLTEVAQTACWFFVILWYKTLRYSLPDSILFCAVYTNVRLFDITLIISLFMFCMEQTFTDTKVVIHLAEIEIDLTRFCDLIGGYS